MNNVERYTTERDVRIAAWLLGLNWQAEDPKRIFDLDPAACAESHWAPYYYTKETNGLVSPWGGWFFLNPPFNDMYSWSKRVWQSVSEPAVLGGAFYIPGDRIEQPFWHEFIEPYRDGRDGGMAPYQLDTHAMKGRAPFGHPGNPTGKDVGSPPFKMMYCVFRRRVAPGQMLPVLKLADCPLLAGAAEAPKKRGGRRKAAAAAAAAAAAPTQGA